MNKEWLYDLYINKKMSQSQIGKLINKSGKLISFRLKKFGITCRTSKEGMLLVDYKERNKKIWEKSGDKIKKSVRKFDTFINKAKLIHGDKYIYIDNYINGKIEIKCPIHGSFFQKPSSHLIGKGCLKCVSINLQLTKEELIKRSKKKHGNKYDYSLIKCEYGRRSTDKIICPVHGVFEQTIENHIRGFGCRKCANELNTKSHETFIDQINNLFGDKYIVKSKYVKDKEDILMSCKEHGDFIITPNRILSKQCCPLCSKNVSRSHLEIATYLKQNGVENIKINNRSVINPLEIDILIENIGIEFNGLYWHSFNKKETFKERMRHYNKVDLANDHKIHLIQIFENEWLYKKDIVKSIILSKINKCKRINARECTIKEIDSKEFNNFTNKNHLQGKLLTTIRVGLYYNNNLVCIMGFNVDDIYEWKITRFANILNHNVVGGASKLLKYFINKYNPSKILSFCDRRYSNGNLYKQLGFNLMYITKPNYFYIKNEKVFSRIRFQKHKLNKLLNKFDSNLTESQNMFNNGYRRLWDAGHYKFLWINKTNTTTFS
jgi:predicted  nucleic acid-binding Zn-ribbon protein